MCGLYFLKQRRALQTLQTCIYVPRVCKSTNVIKGQKVPHLQTKHRRHPSIQHSRPKQLTTGSTGNRKLSVINGQIALK